MDVAEGLPGEITYSNYRTRPHKYVWNRGNGIYSPCTEAKAHGVIACAICTEEFKNPKSAYKHLKSQHFSIIIESKKTNILPCIEEADLLDAQNADNTIVVFGDSVIGSGDAIADLQRPEDIGADLLSWGDAISVPECFVSQANDLGDNDIDITEVVVASNKSIEPECDVPYYDIDEELEQGPEGWYPPPPESFP